MIKRNNIIKIAIDSPAAAGAGTVAKAIADHYKLLKVDTGKAYRLIAFYKLQNPKKVHTFSFARQAIAPPLHYNNDFFFLNKNKALTIRL